MPELLSPDAIERELSGISGWEYGENKLSRTWQRKGFNGAVQVANVVAFLANEMNHHPDIQVHDYNQITVRTTTHAAGGVTSNDLELARRINATVDAG